MNTYQLQFAYPSPPLTANQRMHWGRRAKLTKQLRAEACAKANLADIPPMQRCEVTLTWYVRDHRRRDVDNIVPTLKAYCDGIVDAHVSPDDTPQYMVKRMPEIVYRPGAVPHLVLTITELKETAA